MRSRERVARYLAAEGVEAKVVEFDQSTKNSTLAAQALGCSVAEIAKSVVFAGSGAVVVVLSGDKRVDAKKLAMKVGEDVRVASPEEVRRLTGYPIGGVPPFPHDEGVRVIADASLTSHRLVWAAAGAPNAVFAISVPDLLRLSGGEVSDVSD